MITRSPLVCWGLIGDDLLLWSVEDRRLHVLNATAANVWLLADEPTTVQDMIDSLAASYAISAEVIADDVIELVERFVQAGLCVETTKCQLRPPPIPVHAVPVVPASDATVLGPFRAMGIPFVVESADELLCTELSRILDPLLDETLHLDNAAAQRDVVRLCVRFDSGIWELTANGRSISRTSTRAHALRSVLSECNAATQRAHSSAVVFHAAAADLGDGLVLFPGVSNSGKSTLVTQLVQRGHRYLTDEAVAVDVESLRALPFHKAICLEAGSQEMFPELATGRGLTETWDIDPRTVGPGLLSPGGVIKAVVFPTFEPGAATEIRPLEPFDALQRLISNAFDFDRVGQPAFDAMVRMANALPAYTFIHAGGTGPLDTIENLFARSAAA